MPGWAADGINEWPGSRFAEVPAACQEGAVEKTTAYGEMIALRGMRLKSLSGHQILPNPGKAHFGCFPADRFVGSSMLTLHVETIANH